MFDDFRKTWRKYLFYFWIMKRASQKAAERGHMAEVSSKILKKNSTDGS